MNTGMSRAANLRCKAVKGLGPDLVEVNRLPAALAQHAASCLRCQAEVARYRRLRRELGSLATTTEPAPSSILPGVEQAIWTESENDTSHRNARFVATLAGATAAAGVVAMAMWRRTHTAA